MTAYGVANTVIRNFPDLFDRVVLLIGGQEAQSIAGSLAITGPLRAREELISKRAPVPTAGDAPRGRQKKRLWVTQPATDTQQPAAGVVGVPEKKQDVGAVGAPTGELKFALSARLAD